MVNFLGALEVGVRHDQALFVIVPRISNIIFSLAIMISKTKLFLSFHPC